MEGLPRRTPPRHVVSSWHSRSLCPEKRLEQPGPGIFSETKSISPQPQTQRPPSTPQMTSLNVGEERDPGGQGFGGEEEEEGWLAGRDEMRPQLAQPGAVESWGSVPCRGLGQVSAGRIK